MKWPQIHFSCQSLYKLGSMLQQFTINSCECMQVYREPLGADAGIMKGGQQKGGFNHLIYKIFSKRKGVGGGGGGGGG